MLYNSLKFIHVLAVVAWVGGAVMLVLLGGRAHRAGPTRLAPVARLGSQMGGFFGPVSGVAFVAGVIMVLTTDGLDFEEAWITIGIVVFLVSAVLGARMIGPRWEALADAADSGDTTAIDTARGRLTLVTMVDLTLLTVAIAAMVFKWGA